MNESPGSSNLERWHDLAELSRTYAATMRDERRAANTKTAYGLDWKHFDTWCRRVGAPTLDSTEGVIVVVGAYLEYHADLLAISTLRRRLAGIRSQALDRGIPWPDRSPFQDHLAAIARRQARGSGAAPTITEKILRQMVSCTDPKSAKGARNRAVLLVGFLGAMRRSEISELDLADVTFEDDGMVIMVRRSKTDQEARGRRIYVPLTRHPETCAVRALQAWIDGHRGKAAGPLFMSLRRGGPNPVNERFRMQGRVVDQIVKEYAAKAGAPHAYSAHSLRSGLATAAARRGVNVRTIMKQTGHRSLDSVEHYIQDGQGFTDNAVHALIDL